MVSMCGLLFSVEAALQQYLKAASRVIPS